jgi:NTE family protein
MGQLRGELLPIPQVMKIFPFKKKPVIGIALGSGGARGLSHIGVLEALSEMGIEPDVVSGTSIGSVIGAGYCAGQLEAFKDLALSIDLRTFLFRIMDFGLPRSGLVEGKRVHELLGDLLPGNAGFETLQKPFRCVAADLKSGEERVFSSGPLLHAIRASISIPGIFTPVRDGDRYLVDGGLVNPVQVDQLKRMGATRLLAVDVNRGTLSPRTGQEDPSPPNPLEGWMKKLEKKLREQDSRHLQKWMDWFEPDTSPNLIDVLGGTLHIIENQIGQVRMRLDPPDLCLCPGVGDVEVLDFHHAAEIIEAGRVCVRANRDRLHQLFKMPPPAEAQSAG